VAKSVVGSAQRQTKRNDALSKQIGSDVKNRGGGAASAEAQVPLVKHNSQPNVIQEDSSGDAATDTNVSEAKRSRKDVLTKPKSMWSLWGKK
jgi:hypothetical protein